MTDAIEDDDERQRAVASTRRAFALPPVVPENPPHEEDLPEACRALGLDDWRNLSLNPACPTRRYYRLPWNVRTPLRHTHGRPTFRGTARRRRLGGMPATAEALGPDAEVSLTQNPGQDTQSAAFDKVAPPPRVNFATYSHASLISFDAHNIDIFDPTNTRNSAILGNTKAATAEHAHAVQTDIDGGLSYMFDILCRDYLYLPPSRRGEMLYYTLGKSPVLLRTIELCKEWVGDSHRVLTLTASPWGAYLA